MEEIELAIFTTKDKHINFDLSLSLLIIARLLTHCTLYSCRCGMTSWHSWPSSGLSTAK